MKALKEKRPPRKLWWAVCLALILIGTIGIIFVPHNRPQGPTISKPIGEVSLPPSGVVIPANSTHATTTTTTVAPRATTMGAPTPTVNPAVSIGVTSQIDPAANRQSRSSRTSTSKATNVSKPIARSRPIHLSIPKIHVSAQLSVLGLGKNGTVNVPSNFAVPGWYEGGRSPGQKGSAVILGHVDSTSGAAVFYHLNQLKLGNKVDVTLQDGKRLVFAVIGVRQYKKTNFPDKLVYGARDYPALQLVTCGGIFDPVTHHYLSNIVVFTALIQS